MLQRSALARLQSSDATRAAPRTTGAGPATPALFGRLEQLEFLDFLPRLRRRAGDEMVGEEQRHDRYQSAAEHDANDLDHRETCAHRQVRRSSYRIHTRTLTHIIQLQYTVDNR